MEKKVLIADDDESIVWVLEKLFTEKGFTVIKASEGRTAARELAKKDLTMAMLDINMPEQDGLTILKKVHTEAPVIIMTAEATMDNTLTAMKSGAFDYLIKPFDMTEVEIAIDKALENAALKKEVSSLKKQLKEHLLQESVFIGKSRIIGRLFKDIGRVAPKNVPVLLTGESGTGKELLAKLIHTNSPRAERPFIAVNSAAIPSELMESELFGHVKGAFTGATSERKGKFELADTGTLFLDEIGDMEQKLQAKLLRAIQEGEFYKVGGSKPIKVDIRLISATNQDLKEKIKEKKFREDLFFRINVITINIPPLRERKSDIVLIAEYLLALFSAEMKTEPRQLSKQAEREITFFPWPGNVRELGNVLRRAVLLSPSMILTPDDLALPKKKEGSDSIEDMIKRRLEPFVEKTSTDENGDLYDFIMPFMERPLIKLVLRKTGFNQVNTAKVLGINRNTLRKKIKTLKIKIKDMRPN